VLCCSVLQWFAVCCSVLQCVAVCNTLVAVGQPKVDMCCVAECCSVLQSVAVCVAVCVTLCCSVKHQPQTSLWLWGSLRLIYCGCGVA